LLISLRANEPGLPIRNSEILQNDSDSSVESSHSVKKRASSRVTIFLNVTRVESESPKSWLESSHWLESRYHCQGVRRSIPGSPASGALVESCIAYLYS